MKYLGIDYGAKRIGIAVSDDDGVMAFPKSVIESNGKALTDIVKLCKDEHIGMIVFGESKNLDGKPNSIYEESVTFAKQLESLTGIKVGWEPELYTSQEAERLQGKNAMSDASAAAIILKSFLDKQHHDNNR